MLLLTIDKKLAFFRFLNKKIKVSLPLNFNLITFSVLKLLFKTLFSIEKSMFLKMSIGIFLSPIGKVNNNL